MEDTIQKHILETEEVAINKTLLIIQNSKMIDLANNVSVPKSHVIALFKYQSTVSFVDFKKNDTHSNSNSISRIWVFNKQYFGNLGSHNGIFLLQPFLKKLQFDYWFITKRVFRINSS